MYEFSLYFTAIPFNGCVSKGLSGSLYHMVLQKQGGPLRISGRLLQTSLTSLNMNAIYHYCYETFITYLLL